MSEVASETKAHALQRPGEFFSREEIARLRKKNPWKATFMLVHAWGTILAVWAVCTLYPHPLLILLGVMIVGTRQLGLFVISHDAAHHSLYENRKLNDWVGQWICNRPALGAGIENYRRYHLKHHRFTQQENDPDLHLSAPFPITRESFRRKAIRDLTGQTGYKQQWAAIKAGFGKPGEPWPARLGQGVRRFGPNFAINLVFLTGFALAGAWWLYFLLWVLPFMTWELFVTRIRNIAEHACVPDNDDRLRNTRTTEANWIERLFVAPYFVNYHLEHHLLVSAPAYNLPEAHRLLLAKGLGPRMEVRRGYLSVLKLATSRSEPLAA